MTWGGLDVAGRACDVFWARNALHLGLRVLGVKPGSRVLVPAYICRSVPEAVLAHGTEVEFYRVDEQCRLDLEDIAARIRPPVSGVIAVHYFGLPQPDMQALRTLCDERGVVLIEDCAHVLPVSAVAGHPGFIGHASVFSWRKFLPVFDGGTLLLDSGFAGALPSHNGAPVRLELRACQDTAERLRVRRGRSAHPEAQNEHHGVSPDPKTAPAPLGPSQAPLWRIDPNGDAFQVDALGLPMMHVSRWIRDYSDLLAVAEARRRNWRAIAELLPPEVGVGQLGNELAPDAVPWVFPLRLSRSKDSCRRMRQRGVPAGAWGGVRPHNLSVGLHPQVDRLYDELVFLPIHQDLDTRSLEMVVSGVRRLLLG